MANEFKTFMYVYVRKLIECRCYGPAVMSSRCCDVDLCGKVKKMLVGIISRITKSKRCIPIKLLYPLNY